MELRNECIDTALFINAIENEIAIWNTQTAEQNIDREMPT